MTPEQLKSFRDQIDAYDDEIIKLMVKRAGVVQAVGREKYKVGAAVFHPEREVEIIERMCASNKALGGPCPISPSPRSGLKSFQAAVPLSGL